MITIITSDDFFLTLIDIFFYPRYSVNKDYNNDIIVNVQITICFNIGEETFCIPENGFHLLNNQIIPSCSRNFTDITSEYNSMV